MLSPVGRWESSTSPVAEERRWPSGVAIPSGTLVSPLDIIAAGHSVSLKVTVCPALAQRTGTLLRRRLDTITYIAHTKHTRVDVKLMF